jgi:hypothetical protein
MHKFQAVSDILEANHFHNKQTENKKGDCKTQQSQPGK